MIINPVKQPVMGNIIFLYDEYRGFYVATGVVQRPDVLIIYSVILTSSRSSLDLTSWSNKSISRPELGARLETV